MMLNSILGGLGSNLGCLGRVFKGLGAHFGGSVAQLGAYKAHEAKKSGDRQNNYPILAAKCAPKGRSRGAKGMQKGANIETEWEPKIIKF